MLNPNEYVLVPAVVLHRSYTKESDGGSDVESPSYRPQRHHKAAIMSPPYKPSVAFSSASASAFSQPSPHYSSQQPQLVLAHSASRTHWATLVACMLTALMSAMVTAVAVLLWTSHGVRLAAQLSPHPLVPSVVGEPLQSAQMLGLPRSESRTLLSVPSASASFPPAHIPSVATAMPSSSLVSDASIAALKSMVAAGSLIDDKQGADGNVLIVGVVNFGYIDFALNWLCFARRHNIRNFLLVAIDDRSVLHLNLLGYGAHVMHVQQLFPGDSFGECGGFSTHAYRTVCFNRQTELKSLVVLTALLAGHNALLSDMDIAFVHNPLQYMPLTHYWEMQLEPSEWCTGLYFVQSNPFTVQMETAVVTGIRRNRNKDDQEIFNKWISYHRLYMPDVMEEQLFPLDRRLFPIGKEYGQWGAVVQHNNWAFGATEKRQRQHRRGLYLFNQTTTKAAVEEWVRGKEAAGLNMTSVRFTIGTNAGAGVVFDAAALRGQWTVDGALLQCEVCVACNNMTIPLPPLRNEWPGKLLRDSFKPGDGYKGPSTAHP